MVIDSQNLSQLKLNTEDWERVKVSLSLRNSLAQRNSNNIWGNGFVFDSKNEKLIKAFKKLDKNNRLNQLFYYAQIQKSLYGRAIITINKNSGGDIMLNIVDPYYFSQVGRVFVTETLAVIWQRFVLDNYHFYLKSTYDTEKVVNEWYQESENKMDEIQLIYDAEKVIPKQFQVPKVWHHNLGFVPILETFNYPYRSTLWQAAMFNFIELADWFNCYFLEDTFFDTLKNLEKEINFCHSRILIDGMNQKDIENILTANKINPKIKLGDYIIASDVGAKISPVAGIGDFTKYTNAMNEIMDFYFKFSNSSRFSDGGGAQKTSGEVAQSRNNTVETIHQKITNNEYDFTILIAKSLAAMGEMDYFADDYEFSFKINGNIQKDDTVYLDNIIKQVNLGTMSIQEAIAQLRNVDYNTADTIYQEIKKFNEKNDIMTSNSLGSMDLGFEGSSKQQEGGRTPYNEQGGKS